MATTTKKKTTSSSSSGKGNTRKSSSSTKRTTTKKSTTGSRKNSSSSRNSAAKAKAKKEEYRKSVDELDDFHDKKAFNKSMVLILLFVITIFLYMCFLGAMYKIGTVFTGLFFGIFGWAAWLIPLATLLCVILYFANPGKQNASKITRWIIGVSMAVFFFECMIQNISESLTLADYYHSNNGIRGNFFESLYAAFEDVCNLGMSSGGIICDAIGGVIRNIFGIVGSIFVCIVGFIISLFAGFGKDFVAHIRKRNEYEKEMLEKERIINEDKDLDNYQTPNYSLVDKNNSSKNNIKNNSNQKESNQNNSNQESSNKSHFSFFEIDENKGERERKKDFHNQVEAERNKGKADDSSLERKNTKPSAKGKPSVSSSASNQVENIPENTLQETPKKTLNIINSNNTDLSEDDYGDIPDLTDINMVDSRSKKAKESDESKNSASKSRSSSTRSASSRTSSKTENTAESDEKLKDFEKLLEEAGNANTVTEYVKPPVSLLDPIPKAVNQGNSNAELTAMANKLEDTLKSFGVNVTVENVTCGPTVTRFELKPEVGVKVSRITSLIDDIKLSLAVSNIRIEAPIPGKSAVGIEIPSSSPNSVYFRELIEDRSFTDSKAGIAFAVGKDIYGQIIVSDIAKMPHLLIAGATGSGKSVCINTLIMSLLFKYSPDELKLIMIDPKVVELSVYNGIPHLFCPVVTDAREAAASLNWAVQEMMKRYKLFKDLGVRNIKGYNDKVSKEENAAEAGYEKMPSLVIIVDEFADLMMVASKEVEDAVCRIAQLARAAGIHLVLATQRPSVNVITGVIKANIPSRIAFSTSSAIDSRTILDMAGAERLIGHGDMLFLPSGKSEPDRLQGSFLKDEEIERVIDFIKENNEKPVYDKNVTKVTVTADSVGGSKESSDEPSRDEYFEQCARFCIESERASAGQLQRRFKIGFNRAGRILDELCDAGIVGPSEGTKPRQVLVTMEELDKILGISSGDSQDEEGTSSESEEEVNTNDLGDDSNV